MTHSRGNRREVSSRICLAFSSPSNSRVEFASAIQASSDSGVVQHQNLARERASFQRFQRKLTAQRTQRTAELFKFSVLIASNWRSASAGHPSINHPSAALSANRSLSLNPFINSFLDSSCSAESFYPI